MVTEVSEEPVSVLKVEDTLVTIFETTWDHHLYDLELQACFEMEALMIDALKTGRNALLL
jgi:hypothetical protein